MILNLDALIVHDLGDRVSSVGVGCHAMKELSTFITKLDLVDCISLPPVEIFIVQEFLQLSLDSYSQVCFRVE